MTRVKKWLAAAGALLALVGFLFRGKSPWKARAKKASGEATAARVEALDAGADLKKEKIHNETQQDLDNLADTSDYDLVAGAIADYRKRNDPGADVEGPGADD